MPTEITFKNLPPAGYVPEGSSVSGCQASSWTPPLSGLACTEGLALVTGGGDGTEVVEVFGPEVGF